MNRANKQAHVHFSYFSLKFNQNNDLFIKSIAQINTMKNDDDKVSYNPVSSTLMKTVHHQQSNLDWLNVGSSYRKQNSTPALPPSSSSSIVQPGAGTTNTSNIEDLVSSSTESDSSDYDNTDKSSKKLLKTKKKKSKRESKKDRRRDEKKDKKKKKKRREEESSSSLEKKRSSEREEEHYRTSHRKRRRSDDSSSSSEESSTSNSDGESDRNSKYRRKRSESSRKKKKREHKKRKRSRRRDGSDDDEDRDHRELDELQRVYDFEKKRIRIDPRSLPSSSMIHTTGKTLWSDKFQFNYSNEPDDHLFLYDYKGDPNNLLFGSIFREDIPAYRLYNSRNPYFNESIRWKMISNQNRQQRQLSSLRSDDSGGSITAPSERYWRGSLARKQQDHKLKRISVQADANISGAEEWKQMMNADYISLITDKEYNDDYIVLNMDNDHEEQDEENEANNRKQIGESIEESIYRKTREFSEYTRNHPHDVDMWLQYIHFQDEYFKLQYRKNSASISEKKIAIYEKALEYNPTNTLLLSGHLRESRKLYPFERVQNGWLNALSRCPHDEHLWHEYLLFKKSSFTDFSVSELRSTYQKAISSLLHALVSKSRHDKSSIEAIEAKLVNMFYHACIFEKQSGYTERAIAMCQAIIEINCFCPIIYTTWNSQRDGFKDFWQSETPRFGEEGAKGWTTWLLAMLENEDAFVDDYDLPEESGEQQQLFNDQDELYDDQEDENDEEEDLLDFVNEKGVFVQWLREEEKLSANQLLPCKATNETTAVIESCPDRIVLYEDVINMLFPITSPRIQRELIFIMLEVLDISILYTQRTVNDSLVHESMLNKNDSKHLLSIFSMDDDKKFEYWRPQIIPTKPVMISFIRNIFQQSLSLYPNDPVLSMAFLDFEAQLDLSKAKQLAKSLLKEDQHNILLWNQYALLEKKSDSTLRSTRKVYDTTLSMMNVNTAMTNSRFLLYRCYAEVEMMEGNLQRALHILCSSVNLEEQYQPMDEQHTGSVNNTVILQSQCTFESLLHNLLIGNDDSEEKLTRIQNHVEFIMCYAMFIYLTTSGHVSSSCNIFETVLKSGVWPHVSQYHHVFSAEARSEVYRPRKNSSSGSNHSSLRMGTVHEQYLWLLYLKLLHVLVPISGKKHLFSKSEAIISETQPESSLSFIPRKQLKSVLTQFLNRFPAHPIGLNLYIDMERKSHLSSSMRRFLDQRLLQAPSPVNFLFTIYAELLRGGQESNNRVRSLFERSLDYQACRSNVMLWRMYIRFEVSISQIENAKKLFYRAIDKCPHAKVLWLDVVKLFKDQFDIDHLRELIDLMNEKEILMRSNLEEIVSRAELEVFFKHKISQQKKNNG